MKSVLIVPYLPLLATPHSLRCPLLDSSASQSIFQQLIETSLKKGACGPAFYSSEDGDPSLAPLSCSTLLAGTSV